MTTRISSNLVQTTGAGGIASLANNPIFSSNITARNITANNISISNDVTVTGNLTVQGNTVTVQSETVLIADNILTLNSNATGSPTENAGIEVNRGSSSNVAVRWNESTDTWQFTNDGTNYNNISSVSTGKAIAMSIVFGG